MWTLEMRDGNSDEREHYEERPSSEKIVEACQKWCNDGASIEIGWTLYEDDEEQDEGDIMVEIEPDHESLIQTACKHREGCGYSPDDHNWTAEGEGGLDENPGVWSLGGTRMSFHTHCRDCGLHRKEVTVGAQHNPGEHDTVEYEMPEEWCRTCQKDVRHHVSEKVVNYTDCDEEPNGDFLDALDTRESALERCCEIARERGLGSSRKLYVAYDDREDGTGNYDVYLL